MSTTNRDNVYDKVIAMVNASLTAVFSKASATHGNVDVESAIAQSKELLEKFRNRTNDEIQELKALADWNTFTIAFYGETNAGKSTLIETLRILLGDSDKIATQQEFKRLASDPRLDPKNLEALDLAVQQLKEQLTEYEGRANLLAQKLHLEVREQQVRVTALNAAITEKRKNFGLWQKLVFRFRRLDEEKALPEQEVKLTLLQADNKTKADAADAELRKVQAALEERRRERAETHRVFTQLTPLQDGAIIGNGRSDFTLQSRAYRFAAGDQHFQLIDVPGIEGDEKQVMGAIEDAVKKAHAVFYVTRAATPPGSGSEGQEGTIHKIKRQLGKQTEVWAIYNKSATHPQILQAETLINSNDSAGLEEMDRSLSATLGTETYQGYICLSAMPAFLASASCLLPHNPHWKSRDKFLAAISPTEILERSGLHAFVRFIRRDICQNFQKKIQAANLKKIRSCVREGVSHLENARNHFAMAAKKLEKQQASASSQIDALVASTGKKLKSECQGHLGDKKTVMRNDIYGFIGGNKSNDEFKLRLTADIEELKTTIGRDLEIRFSTVYDEFKGKAKAIVSKNQKNVDEILQYTIDDPFSSLKLSFDVDFKLNNGINMVGIMSALGGATALIWGTFLASNPVGWTTAAVLGAVGLVFTFYKAVRSYFSSDYKKEQQRKAVDENLNAVFRKLSDMLGGNLDSASAKIQEALAETKNQMRIPYEQCLNTQVALDGIAANMRSLHDKLQPKAPPTAPIFDRSAAIAA
jgi:hypothetical protein